MAQSDLFLKVLVAAAVSAQISFDHIIATADKNGIFFFLLLLLCFFGSGCLSR
jgi:hypothetical protein